MSISRRGGRSPCSRPGAGAQRVDAIAGELVCSYVEVEPLGTARRPLVAADDAVQELRHVHRLRWRRAEHG